MFRRDLRLFLHSLRTLILLIALFACGCIGMLFAVSGADNPTTVRLSLVLCNLDTNSQYGSLLLTLASNHDIVQSVIDLEICDSEPEAEQRVRDGAVAAVVIPEGFFGQISHGEGVPCRMILNSAGEGARAVIQSYASIGSDVLTSGQLIVFTGDYFAEEAGVSSEEARSFNTYMNLYAFHEFESASNQYFVVQQVPYTNGGLSQSGHYLIIYSVFFLSLLILGYYHLYQSDLERGRLLMLRSSGLSDRAFLRWKWSLPFLFSCLFLLAFILVVPRFKPLVLTPATILYALYGLLFTAIFGSFLSIGLGRVSGAVLFTIHIVGLFFCGGIIPYSRLSPFVLTIGDLTPLGAVYHATAPLAGERLTVWPFVLSLVYLPIALYLCVRRLNSIRTGKGSL